MPRAQEWALPAGKVGPLLEAMGRPDCSDSGMVYFLATGNEQASVQDLNDLLHGRMPRPVMQRPEIRMEAENFQLQNYTVPPRRMGSAVSQRMAAELARGKQEGTIRTTFHQPYAAGGNYDIDVRYFAVRQARLKLTLLVNGTVQGQPHVVPDGYQGWQTWKVRDVALQLGDEIAVKVNADGDQTGSLDFVQLNRRAEQAEPTALQ
jgi:hypothetical protein